MRPFGAFCLALSVAFLVLGPRALLAQCTPDPVLGCWETPGYDWKCQLEDICDDPAACPNSEFSAAALIPTGNHRGKVLLWRKQPTVQTTVVYLFDPANPRYLYKVDGTLASNIFCSGLSWAPDGTLLVAGGEIFGHLAPKQVYRFVPGSLDFAGPTGTPCQVGQIPGNPWTPPLEEMTLGRYYPTLVTSPRETIDPSSNAIPGGSAIVLGGAPDGAGDDGNEWWQFLPPRPAVQWSRTFYPDGGDATHGVPPSTPSGGLAPQLYHRKSLVPSIPASFPTVKFDTYAQGYFLASILEGETLYKHDLFVAGDTDTRFTFGPSILRTEGDSWVARLPYAGGSTTSEFQLWRGQNAGAGLSTNQDRQYGAFAFMQMRAANPPASNGKNRVIAVGGVMDTNPLPGTGNRNYVINQTVQEHVPGTNPVAAAYGGSGDWVEKTNLPPVGSFFNNAVLTPTGDIVVIGGVDGIQASDGSPTSFQREPRLLHPGQAGSTGGASVTTLAPAPNAPGSSNWWQRGYHNFALLLPDGRIISAGGGWGGPSSGPDPRFSADVFSPPYLAYVQRPRINAIESFDAGAGQWVADDQFPFDTQATPSVFRLRVQRTQSASRSIDTVVLLRPAAITHNYDADQRYLELDFTSEPDPSNPTGFELVTAAAPRDDLGPAGWYLVFVVEKNTSPPAGTPPRGPTGGRFVRFH